RVGDAVVGSNGLPTRVIGVFPQGRRPVYRITAQDGASTLACGEHLWTVRTPEDKRRDRWRTVQTVTMLGQERRGHIRRFELPLVDAVEFVPQTVPMDPYALGLLLGDGCITGQTTPTFTTTDPELVDALQEAFDNVALPVDLTAKPGFQYVLKHRGASRGGLRVANPVTTILRDLDLDGTTSSTKFVPKAYLLNSSWVRLAVLQGLLDTDGGPVPQQDRTCRVQYCTTSSRLRDDVVFLVRSLGGVAYWRTRRAEGRPPGLANGRPVPYRNDAYVVDIRLPEGYQPFRMKRKHSVYEKTGGGRPMRYIERIEPVGEAETMCIQVSAADSLYVTDDFLVTHNSLNDAFIILDEAQNTTPEQMKMFLTRLGFGSKMVVTGDVTQVDLPGGKSGLRLVRDILTDIDDVHFAELTASDVVRHRLVGAIVEAYGRWDEKQPGAHTQAQAPHP
ncbi:MAG: PhoH family protein, partial [Ornithinibacter sp.]